MKTTNYQQGYNDAFGGKLPKPPRQGAEDYKAGYEKGLKDSDKFAPKGY